MEQINAFKFPPSHGVSAPVSPDLKVHPTPGSQIRELNSTLILNSPEMDCQHTVSFSCILFRLRQDWRGLEEREGEEGTGKKRKEEEES